MSQVSQGGKTKRHFLMGGAAALTLGAAVAGGAYNAAAQMEDQYSKVTNSSGTTAAKTKLLDREGNFLSHTDYRQTETVRIPASGPASYSTGFQTKTYLLGFQLSEERYGETTIKQGEDYAMGDPENPSSETDETAIELQPAFSTHQAFHNKVRWAAQYAVAQKDLEKFAGSGDQAAALEQKIAGTHGSVSALEQKYKREARLAEADVTELLGIPEDEIDYRNERYVVSVTVHSGCVGYCRDYDGPEAGTEYTYGYQDVLPRSLQKKLNAAREPHKNLAGRYEEQLIALTEARTGAKKYEVLTLEQALRREFIQANGGSVEAARARADDLFRNQASALANRYGALAIK